MPADASIYSLIRQQQPQPGQLDQYGQALQLRHLMDTGQLNALQRQQLEKSIAEDDAVKAAFSGMQPGQTVKDILPGIFKASPKTGLSVQKTLTEQEKAAADLKKTQIETHGIQVKQLRDQLAGVADDNGLAAFRENSMKLYGPQVASTIPQSVNDPAFAAWREKNILTADELVKRLTPEWVPHSAGGKTVMVQKNSFAPGFSSAPIEHTQTPDSIASNKLGYANLAETKRHHAVTEGQEQFGPPQEVTGADGKPQLVMQNKKNGQLVDANTRQPIAAVGPKVGEAAQKQQVGVQNTKNAIQEYRAALANFQPQDVLKPDARAKMGTVYNNMLLQAKEAFNLGVLNGPDYQILQEVITAPTSLKGGLTSKEALDAQAAKLDEIMGRIGTQITQTQSGQTPSQAPKTTAPQFTRAQIDAELRRRGVIK